MNLSAQEIATEILTLPESDQQKVFDFIKLTKAKYSLVDQENPITAPTEDRDQPNDSEVMKHFQGSLQKNHRLGELLAR